VVFVCKVEWAEGVISDGPMEGSCSLNSSIGTVVDARKKFRSSESSLWYTTSQENRSVTTQKISCAEDTEFTLSSLDRNFYSFRFWKIELRRD
jgi:hypothetical protein